MRGSFPGFLLRSALAVKRNALSSSSELGISNSSHFDINSYGLIDMTDDASSTLLHVLSKRINRVLSML